MTADRRRALEPLVSCQGEQEYSRHNFEYRVDARGVISLTERQSYILRVREIAKACGEAWLATERREERRHECTA